MVAAFLWVSWEVGAGVLGAAFWAPLSASSPPQGSIAARQHKWECLSQGAGRWEHWPRLG